MRRRLLCLLLAALLLTATGCANWEEPSDPLGELSEFYGAENETPEPEPLTTFTLPYFAGESLDPVTTTETVQSSVGALLYEKLFELGEQFLRLTPDKPQIFYVWGHSYEFDVDDNWEYMESILKKLAFHDDIFLSLIHI